MIIDNLIVNNLKKELHEKLVNSRIEKITQPEKDCFLVQLWNKKSTYKLLISLNASTYRICLTDKQYKVPKQSSAICQLLKKHLEAGYVLAVEQINSDRIISFKIESIDNVKDKYILYLIVELTGKYSNLILTDENYKIIGCYKQIDETQNEERQVIPSKQYYPITNKSNKTEPAELDQPQFTTLTEKYSEQSAKKFLVNNFLSISSHTAQLLLDKTGLTDKKVKELKSEEKNDLLVNLKQFGKDLKNDNIYLDFATDNSDSLTFKFSDNKETPEISKIIDNYYFQQSSLNGFNLLKGELKKIIEKNLSRVKDRISIQQKIQQKATESESTKQAGELLLANIHSFPEMNLASVELEDFYNDSQLITIELDENLTISENAQKFFKKYTKLKNSQEISQKLLNELVQELQYLEDVDNSIEIAENIDELKEVEAELENEDYIAKKLSGRKKDNDQKKNLLTIKSSDGLDIIIGKNNLQNDFLTTKFARENDIWLHTRLIPGSHVVIKTENGQKQISEKTLYEAANIAAKYSKAKYSSNVCVIYTKIKYVKKPAHSKPGFVIYSNEKAIYVTPLI